MKSIAKAAIAVSLIVGNASLATAAKPDGAGNKGSKSSPPGQTTRKSDPDQGDDNAVLRAIKIVCTMDTPAAKRSAICFGDEDSPASP